MEENKDEILEIGTEKQNFIIYDERLFLRYDFDSVYMLWGKKSKFTLPKKKCVLHAKPKIPKKFEFENFPTDD